MRIAPSESNSFVESVMGCCQSCYADREYFAENNNIKYNIKMKFGKKLTVA